MSRAAETAFEDVKKSIFNFKDNHTIEVLNAVIFWRNFSGTPNKWGNAAKTFNLAVTEDIANQLAENGWRIRDVDVFENQKLYFVNIKVNMDSAYPPIISLYSEYRGKRSKRAIDNETVGELDKIDIQSADCIVNAYESRLYPGKVTGYLKKLSIIQEPDIEFGGKYDDWMGYDDEEADARTGLAIPDDYSDSL